MRLPARWILALFCVVALACSDDSRSTPTSPVSVDNLSGALFWKGTLTFEEASPRGDCLVEGFLANPTSKQVTMRAETARPGATYFWLRLTVLREFDEDEDWYFEDESSPDPYWGFYPGDYYEGSYETSGAFVLAYGLATPVQRGLTGSDYCSIGWVMTGGSLVGEISSDGSRLRGDVTETFRKVEDGSTFTIRSRLDLQQKSYEESL